MARGAFRGAFGACLTLAVLQVVTTREGSGRVGEALSDVNSLIQRAMDPSVPAIPDRGYDAAAAARSEARGNTGPGQLAPVNPSGAAAADPAPQTQTTWTGPFPFPLPQPVR